MIHIADILAGDSLALDALAIAILYALVVSFIVAAPTYLFLTASAWAERRQMRRLVRKTLAEQLTLILDRVHDYEHPDGWLESWPDDVVITVRAAIDELKKPLPPEAPTGPPRPR